MVEYPDGKDPRIEIDKISIQCGSVASMSDRYRSEDLCYLGRGQGNDSHDFEQVILEWSGFRITTVVW